MGEKGQLKLMPNLDITVFHTMVILMDIMDIQLSLQLNLVMNMIFLGTVMLALSEPISWERGQLNLDIMDMDITDTLTIMDTVLLDLVSLDMPVVEPLLSPEAPKVLANKDDAIHSIP